MNELVLNRCPQTVCFMFNYLSIVIQIFRYSDSDRSSYIIKPVHGKDHCVVAPAVNPIFPSVIPDEARFLFKTEVTGFPVSLWRADYQNYSHSWFVYFNLFGEYQLIRFLLHTDVNVFQVDVYDMKPVHFDYSDILFDAHAYNCPGPKPPTNFTVTGTLSDLNTSFPIGNITIKLDGKTSTQTTTSLSDGRFSFKGVVPGTLHHFCSSFPSQLVADLKLKKRSGDWLIGFFNGPILPEKHSNLYMYLYDICELYFASVLYQCKVGDTFAKYAVARDYSWQSITVTNHGLYHDRTSPVYVKQWKRQPVPFVGSKCYAKIYNGDKLLHTLVVPDEGSVKDNRWNIGYIDGFNFVVQNELVEE
ncbi:hypothetical protein GEMRC1_008502 [Eukaryota sp. GEM-RC1]